MEKIFDRELKRGTLELVLLKQLSGRQMYGYELVTTLEKLAGPSFQIKEGTLYPVLYRLENAGFVETRWETLDRGVPRKYYAITHSGEQQLKKLQIEWENFSKTINNLLGVEANEK